MIAPRKVRLKWQARYRDADDKIRSAGIFDTQREAYAAKKANGTTKARAKTALAPEKVALAKKLRADGKSAPDIAKALQISRASVYRALEAS